MPLEPCPHEMVGARRFSVDVGGPDHAGRPHGLGGRDKWPWVTAVTVAQSGGRAVCRR